MSNNLISLANLNKAEILAALYNASKPLGMGILHFDPKPMTTEQADDLLKGQTYFDYLKGRVMKIDLKGDTLNPWLYDRDNGDGAAWRALRNIIDRSKTIDVIATEAKDDSDKSKFTP